MSFAPLPPLLAGPIVRRATAEEVNIWLCTSRALPEPELLLYDPTFGYEPIATVPGSETLRIGERLFVHLLTVAPLRNVFPTGRPIAYDVTFAGGGTLADLTNLETLVVRGLELPSFVLQEADQLHAIYGSCRKLHGPGPDGMRALELLLKDKGRARPSTLFLGGDQIYADDVDGGFLRQINALAIDVMGKAERVPGLPISAHSPLANRGEFLKEAFSSGEMEHHLLTFGEFAATYLFAWNHELWIRMSGAPGAPPTKDTVLGARAARLVLANTVTYMTFDDHEITDDWFLNDDWRKKVIVTKWAERVITNGMAAYFCFQAWGNNPADFLPSFRAIIEQFARTGTRVQEASFQLVTHGKWSYLAPTWPPTLVLDTRTMRESSEAFPDQRQGKTAIQDSPVLLNLGGESIRTQFRNTDAPRLLGSLERGRLNQLLNSVARGEPLIVVAASPILGFRPIEEMQEVIGGVSPAGGDFESWAANRRNLLDFAELTLNRGLKFVTILSGDVHYAFEIAASISTRGQTLPLAQFCSSSFKNRPIGLLGLGARFLRLSRRGHHPVAWWDFKKGSDGPVTTCFANSIWLLRDLVGKHGRPSFVMNEKLHERDGVRVVLANNAGEFVMDGEGVRHRFWLPGGASFIPNDFVDWKASAWPAKRFWPEGM